MKKTGILAALIFAAALLSGCDDSSKDAKIISLQNQLYQQQQTAPVPGPSQVAAVPGTAPVVVQSQPVYVPQTTVVHDSDATSGLVTGMMLGHMLSGGGGGGSSNVHSTQVVNNHYHNAAPPRRSWSSRSSATARTYASRSSFRSSFRSRR